MMELQKRIQNNFNKASKTYDSVASIQRYSAEFLVNKLLELEISTPKKILDLGTGTGYVPSLLIKKFPCSLYLLNDISDKMIELCKLRFLNHNNFTFSNDNMETLDVNHYNLIISNFAMQWASDLLGVLKKFNNQSDIFAFSTLLDGTFQEWYNAIHIDAENRYPTKKQLLNYCNDIKSNHELYYWTKDFSIEFGNYFSCMQYLKDLGAKAIDQSIKFELLRSLIKKDVKKITMKYKIFFGIFRKIL